MAALNPVMRVGRQVAEVFVRHDGRRAARRTRRPSTCCAASASRTRDRRPQVPARAVGRHAPAGDDRDRAGLAPDVLIADEPTTALDVTVQAEILALVRELQAERGWSSSGSRTTWASSPRSPTRWPSCTAAAIVEHAPVERGVRAAAAPVHAALIGSRPRGAGHAAEGAVRDHRRPAADRRGAAGLPVPPALPDRRGALLDRRSGHPRAGGGAYRRLSSRWLTSTSGTGRCGRWTASRSSWSRGARSAWSASPARASRPPAA